MAMIARKSRIAIVFMSEMVSRVLKCGHGVFFLALYLTWPTIRALL